MSLSLVREPLLSFRPAHSVILLVFLMIRFAMSSTGGGGGGDSQHGGAEDHGGGEEGHGGGGGNIWIWSGLN